MHVSQIMTKPVVTIDPDASVADVARKLRETNAGSVVVEMDTPVGIITETDLIGVLADGGDSEELTASEVMSSDLITVDGFESVENAVDLMKEHGIKKLPVMYGGALVGIVTTTDVTYHMPDIVHGEAQAEEELLDELEGMVD